MQRAFLYKDIKMGRRPKNYTPEEEIKKTESDTEYSSENDFKPDVENIPYLIFNNSGWCEELKFSYFRGPYKPKSIKEYEALKKFSAK